MASATLSDDQAIFSLAMMANLSANGIGPAGLGEQELAATLRRHFDNLRPQLGAWELVWGPVIREAVGELIAGNTMFVARDLDRPSRLVVSIAGTNPFSAFDWLVEDAFVSGQVGWRFGSPSPGLRPALARGTDLGLAITQALAPGAGFPGAPLMLDAFLHALPPGELAITVAGHSLGGALAPVTALWLHETKSTWDPAGRATLSCLAAAGPTPGNGDFAAHYAASPLGSRTTRIHNTLDVVPHAWADTDLRQIPDLYRPAIPPDFRVTALALLARQISASGDYAQILPQAPGLRGVVRDLKLPFSEIDTLPRFLLELTHQHVDAYFELMGIADLGDLLGILRQSIPFLQGSGLLEALGDKLERRLPAAASEIRADVSGAVKDIRELLGRFAGPG